MVKKEMVCELKSGKTKEDLSTYLLNNHGFNVDVDVDNSGMRQTTGRRFKLNEKFSKEVTKTCKNSFCYEGFCSIPKKLCDGVVNCKSDSGSPCFCRSRQVEKKSFNIVVGNETRLNEDCWGQELIEIRRYKTKPEGVTRRQRLQNHLPKLSAESIEQNQPEQGRVDVELNKEDDDNFRSSHFMTCHGGVIRITREFDNKPLRYKLQNQHFYIHGILETKTIWDDYRRAPSCHAPPRLDSKQARRTTQRNQRENSKADSKETTRDFKRENARGGTRVTVDYPNHALPFFDYDQSSKNHKQKRNHRRRDLLRKFTAAATAGISLTSIQLQQYNVTSTNPPILWRPRQQ
ncbi:unnamed protein product [Bursaphelenchus okinawaensis]|uniref:Uncharacterized protein n=1 Tax=Bursaphelenchus okinawaensis TaxID=465554 RepID=A0A811K9G4_9BILA|nr:unnamed protein product [Bursaphelenchus okinawaensis]CAG9094924.1 unnamed protein product [Bursaphelenchus okinawaensis]